MKKVFHLQSCSTCQRIIKEIKWPKDITFQNIKEENISKSELALVKKHTESYAAIFSKRAMKYRGLGLHEKTLSEADYEKYILEEYTFLKRPVIVYGDDVFVGNSKKNVEAMKAYFDAK